MDDSLNDTLNSTFSIEEEQSFLGHFGTPIQFKKLMQKPADNSFHKGNLENIFSDSLNSPVLNSKPKTCGPKKPLATLNDVSFLSPLPLTKTQSKTSKGKMRNLASISMSPINYAGKKSNVTNTNNYTQSTPYIRQNAHVDQKFQQSNRNISKNNQFLTPQRVVNLKSSPITDFLWSLNKKREESRIEEEAKILQNIKTTETKKPFASMTKEEFELSFANKIKNYAEKHIRPQSQSIIEIQSETKTVPESKSVSKPMLKAENNQTISPDLRAALLAHRAQQEESKVIVPKEIVEKKEELPLEQRMANFLKIKAAMDASMSQLTAESKRTPQVRKQETNVKTVKNTLKPSLISTPLTTNRSRLPAPRTGRF